MEVIKYILRTISPRIFLCQVGSAVHLEFFGNNFNYQPQFPYLQNRNDNMILHRNKNGFV